MSTPAPAAASSTPDVPGASDAPGAPPRTGTSGILVGHPGGSTDPAAASVATLAVAVLGRPDLWWTAWGELRRMAPRLWWRSAPHLPLPDRRLWEFRMVTAYGRADASPTRGDVVTFLEWCRAASASSDRRPGGRR